MNQTAVTLHSAFETARPFLSRAQFATLQALCNGSEGPYFDGRIRALACQLLAMPKTGEQDGEGVDPVVYLHYFLGGMDWYIVEKDEIGGVEQTHGFVVQRCDHHGGDLGYVSIAEIVACGVELDLHFEPCPLSQILAKMERAGS
jgi:hypothetical protein